MSVAADDDLRRRPELPDWRHYLDAASGETAQLADLESEAQALDLRRHQLADAMQLIRNRCIQRRRQAAMRDAMRRRTGA